MRSQFEIFCHSAAVKQPFLVDVRRSLHQYPELSWKEHQTAGTVRKKLAEAGLTISPAIAGTGFYTDIKGYDEGPLIAYRADMDALPIQDLKQVSYCSKIEGVAHMCGHDYHTTVALGVALVLSENRDKFKGTVRVFWQPAEESTPSGAPEMITNGVLNGVSAVFGIHCDPNIKSGNIGFRDGPVTASYDAFEIEVSAANSAHSARPHTGQDTIWIANQLVNNLYQLSTRITDSRFPSVISVSTFHGGHALNIIPQKVSFGGTIRTSDETTRQIIKTHIQKLCTGFESIYNVKILVSILSGAPPVINNAKLFDFAKELLSDALGHEHLEYPEQSMGGEDFAYYSVEAPSLFMRIGTCNSPETSHALHTSFFDVDETTISQAVTIQVYLLTSYLQKLKQISTQAV